MPGLAHAFAVIGQYAQDWGVCLSPPLSDAAVTATKADLEQLLGLPLPLEYDRFLAWSNGLATQRGELFDAASILKWNEEHWRRTTSFREIPGGVVFESLPKTDPPPIEYLWAGCYGNMDMYSFHLATKCYRVTNLGFDYVYGQFQHLGDFLLYLADPSSELAGLKNLN